MDDTTGVKHNIPFTEEQIKKMLKKAVGKVYKTMMSEEAKLKEESACIEAQELNDKLQAYCGTPETTLYSSTISFFGDVNGSMHIYATEAMANRSVCAFLDLDEEDLEEESPDAVTDTLGEIANMTGGVFKKQICEKDFDCTLSLPKVVHESNVSVDSSKAEFKSFYTFSAFETECAIIVMMEGEKAS